MKIYLCKKCGNIVLKLEDKTEALSCCGEKMELLTPNTVEAAVEKHLPVYEITENIINIKVGEVEHPMILEHYISFIILANDEEYIIKRLSPNQKPEVSFSYNEKYNKIYSYCNLHGLWLTEIN